MVAPKAFLDFVDANEDKFIQRLAEAVAIPRYVTVRPHLPITRAETWRKRV